MGNEQSQSPFSGGTIEFSFPNRSRPTFLAGETVSGLVIVNLTGDLFPVKNLTLGLYGYEFVQYVDKPSEDSADSETRKHAKFDIIRLEVPIADFTDFPPKLGRRIYPFCLQIPEWLPASFAHQHVKLGIAYKIFAQFTPVNES